MIKRIKEIKEALEELDNDIYTQYEYDDEEKLKEMEESREKLNDELKDLKINEKEGLKE